MEHNLPNAVDLSPGDTMELPGGRDFFFFFFFPNADKSNHPRPWKSESGEADASALLCF